MIALMLMAVACVGARADDPCSVTPQQAAESGASDATSVSAGVNGLVGKLASANVSIENEFKKGLKERYQDISDANAMCALTLRALVCMIQQKGNPAAAVAAAELQKTVAAVCTKQSTHPQQSEPRALDGEPGKGRKKPPPRPATTESCIDEVARTGRLIDMCTTELSREACDALKERSTCTPSEIGRYVAAGVDRNSAVMGCQRRHYYATEIGYLLKRFDDECAGLPERSRAILRAEMFGVHSDQLGMPSSAVAATQAAITCRELALRVAQTISSAAGSGPLFNPNGAVTPNSVIPKL
jgi:hypothetical protein